MALQSVLMSPRFLFRLEQAPAAVRAVKASAIYRLNDQDLASRLSFFLWGTAPDAELMKAASAGSLRTPLGLEKQVRRMLADRRADALSTRFAAQWLRLQDLEKIHPDVLLFPQYDDTLAQSMAKETELFFDSIVREDRPVLDLLTADYSFVNERLAKHYGIPNVTGNEFKRVQMPEYRRGLFGQGSILTLTSYADRTSPVQRGKWILEVLFGAPPPPPPPNVPLFDDTKAVIGGKNLSTRERMEEHRKNPACTSCHKVIDPLGLTLENFDATGVWRIKDNEVPVDSVGDLYDGTKMNGPAGLREGDGEAHRHLPRDLHREPDDLRARPPCRVHRHAGDPRHPARRRQEPQSLLVVHARRRQQRRVPDGEARHSSLDHRRRRGEAVNVRSTTVEESECLSPTRTFPAARC